jgi:hypothetical protein
MTTTISRSTRTSQSFVAPPTSGLEDDALLVKRPPESEEWSRRIDDLLDIRGMEDDWDGAGTPAPAVALVHSALQLALILSKQRFPPPCRIMPGRTGTVLFEWQDTDGSYSELEVTHPHHAEWVHMGSDEPTTSGQFEW